MKFAVLELLKGRLSSPTIEFTGALSERDDPNDRAVPYDFIRPGGRSGNCYAREYRVGAEYLLLLRRGEHKWQPKELTPSWAPVSPTNEQLFGSASDPWFVWVSEQLHSDKRPEPKRSVPFPIKEIG